MSKENKLYCCVCESELIGSVDIGDNQYSTCDICHEYVCDGCSDYYDINKVQPLFSCNNCIGKQLQTLQADNERLTKLTNEMALYIGLQDSACVYMPKEEIISRIFKLFSDKYIARKALGGE